MSPLKSMFNGTFGVELGQKNLQYVTQLYHFAIQNILSPWKSKKKLKCKKLGKQSILSIYWFVLEPY